MKQITKLTSAQEARFPEFVRKWIDIGLSTQPADRPRAEKAIAGMYELETRVIAVFGHERYDGFAGLSERPSEINLDNEGRLHSETGMSIRYAGTGWGLFHWHGTQVPADWIIDRSKLTPTIALKQENVEQRRAACEILGWANILHDLKAKTIDKDVDPQIGELVEVKLPDLRKKAKFLRVQCGTGREFAIGIPPHINKALDAQAWVVGLEPHEFQRPEVRA